MGLPSHARLSRADAEDDVARVASGSRGARWLMTDTSIGMTQKSFGEAKETFCEDTTSPQLTKNDSNWKALVDQTLMVFILPVVLVSTGDNQRATSCIFCRIAGRAATRMSGD